MRHIVDIRARLHALRQRHKMTQAELATALGFKDRQTLSAIENGDRRITPEEMVRAASVFNVSIDYFTDPLELAGEGEFSWRQSKAKPGDIDQFEIQAGRWIATYRYLSRLRGDPVNSLLRRVALNEKSSFEQAADEGEAIGLALKLSDSPAANLAQAVERELETLVLYVDAVPGVSGAACQLDQLNAILINRKEVPARRAFDLAHELFHLLTWHSMKPSRVEDESSKGMNHRERRIESLAENFAAGLLMPRTLIARLLDSSPLPLDIKRVPRWLVQSASGLGVSPKALHWRLVNLNFLQKDQVKPAAEAFPKHDTPPKFSGRFMQVLGWGIEEGHLTARKAALVLGVTLDELAKLFEVHDQEVPFAL